MINLMPWRERCVQRCWLLWGLLSSLLLFGVCLLLIYNHHHYQQQLAKYRRQMHSQTHQSAVVLKVTQDMQQQGVKLVNQRHHHVTVLLNQLYHWPASIELNRVSCEDKHCVVTIEAKTMHALRHVDNVQNLKRQECPWCYQAQRSIKW